MSDCRIGRVDPSGRLTVAAEPTTRSSGRSVPIVTCGT
jgi:hypothetical protein